MCHIIFSNISILCFFIFILGEPMVVVKGSKKLATSTKEQRETRALQMWNAPEQSKRIHRKSISPRIDDRSNSSRIDASGNISVHQCGHSKYVNVEGPNATFIITLRSFLRNKRSSNADNRFDNSGDNELHGDKHLRDVNNGLHWKPQFTSRRNELYENGGNNEKRVMDEEVQQEVNKKVTKKAEGSKEVSVSSYKSMSSSNSQAVLRQDISESLNRDIPGNEEKKEETSSEIGSKAAEPISKDMALLSKLEQIFINTGDYIVLVLLKALKERFHRLKVGKKFWAKVNETSSSGGKTHAEVKEMLADDIKEKFNESFRNKMAELLGILVKEVTISSR